MLERKTLQNKNKMICNWCGEVYTEQDTILSKGNIYFCSKECVLEYEQATKEEKV